jgi:hypothetical protein
LFFISIVLKTRIESLIKKWKRLASKQKQENAPPPVPKKSIETSKVLSNSDSGLFSKISNVPIPKKTNQLRTVITEGNKRATQVTDNKSHATQHTSINSSAQSPIPLKRKFKDMGADEEASKRARRSPPLQPASAVAAATATTQSASAPNQQQKKRVRWAENLEQIRVFEKVVSIEETESGLQQASHAYNQDRLNEKMFFTMQREEKRKKLEAMVPQVQWQQPLPLSGIYSTKSECNSEEAAARRIEHEKRPPVRYHRREDIPHTPSSPNRGINIDPSILKTLAVLTAKAAPSATISNNAPNNINSFTNQYQNPQQNYTTQMQNYGNLYAENRMTYHNYPASATSMQYQQQPYFEQPLLQQRVFHQNIPPVNLVPPPSTQIPTKPSKSIRCKFFETKVGCRNGQNCPFFHAGVDPVPVGGVKEFDPEIAKQVQQSRMAAKHHNYR